MAQSKHLCQRLSTAECLSRLVRGKLSDDLRRWPWKGNPNVVAGHCYVASEALYHMLGGRAEGWKPMHVRHEGQAHWYLQRGDEILDATWDQFREPPVYSAGRGKGFLTKRPSKRAVILIKRVRDLLEQIIEKRDLYRTIEAGL